MRQIGVVGSGLVGSCFEGLDEFEMVRHSGWKDAGCMKPSTTPR